MTLACLSAAIRGTSYFFYSPYLSNPYLNVFVFGLNLDSVLNDIGMLLACGVLKTVPCGAIAGRFLDTIGGTKEGIVVPAPPPVFDSQAYEREADESPLGEAIRETSIVQRVEI